MNGKQKVAVWIGLVLVVAMGVYPPWKQRFTYDPNWGLRADTYSWIWGPGVPRVRPSAVPSSISGKEVFMAAVRSVEYWESSLDVSRLMIQWILVCCVAGALVWTFSRPMDGTGSARDSSDADGSG